MCRSLITPVALAALLLPGLQARAQAVHKCMIAGHPVFQASPCRAEVRPSALPIPAAPPAESASTAKKRTLAEVLRAREAALPAAAPPAPTGDGSKVLRARMGAI